jgi:hypothetical protein
MFAAGNLDFADFELAFVDFAVGNLDFADIAVGNLDFVDFGRAFVDFAVLVAEVFERLVEPRNNQ